MHRALLAIAAIALAFASDLTAQMRVTPVVGYLYPTKDIGLTYAERSEAMPNGFLVTRTGSPIVGMRILGDLGGTRFSWEASIIRSWTQLKATPILPATELASNSIARNESPVSLRLAATFGPPGGLRGRVFTGPVAIFAGEDWLRPGFAEWGAVGGVGGMIPVSGHLDMAVQIENYSYTTWGDRWQHDLGLSFSLIRR